MSPAIFKWTRFIMVGWIEAGRFHQSIAKAIKSSYEKKIDTNGLYHEAISPRWLSDYTFKESCESLRRRFGKVTWPPLALSSPPPSSSNHVAHGDLSLCLTTQTDRSSWWYALMHSRYGTHWLLLLSRPVRSTLPRTLPHASLRSARECLGTVCSLEATPIRYSTLHTRPHILMVKSMAATASGGYQLAAMPGYAIIRHRRSASSD